MTGICIVGEWTERMWNRRRAQYPAGPLISEPAPEQQQASNSEREQHWPRSKRRYGRGPPCIDRRGRCVMCPEEKLTSGLLRTSTLKARRRVR